VREVVGMVLMGETNDAPAFVFCAAEVMRGLAVLVKVARHLAVPAGMAMTMASEASWLCACGGWCTSM
jgi:hypothetical protein